MTPRIDYFRSALKYELKDCKFKVVKLMTGVWLIDTIYPPTTKAGEENQVYTFDKLESFPNLGMRFEKKLKTYTSYPVKSYKNTKNAIKYLTSFFNKKK